MRTDTLKKALALAWILGFASMWSVAGAAPAPEGQKLLAELKAQAVVEGSGWGVHAETGAVIIFKGSSFASRDQTCDEVFSFSGSIAITAPADVFFAPLYGTPVAPAVWELSGIGETRSVSVNSLGILSY